MPTKKASPAEDVKITVIPRLELVDPEQIIVKNVRVAQPTQQLINSVRENGLRQPIGLLQTADGKLHLRFGGRRRLACIAAKRKALALVIDGAAGTDEAEIERIFEQLDENDNREDLTAAERAGAVAELFEYGATEATVTKRTGLNKKLIAAARKGHASETARTLAAQYPLDLAQYGVVAEFDEHPEIAEQLAEVARDNPGQFDHAAQRARDHRTEKTMLAARAAELTEQGVTVVDQRPDHDLGLSYWADGEGKPLTPANHRECPGNVVKLWAMGHSESRRIDESWFCTDPQGNGHRKLRTSTGEAAKTGEEASAERKRVIEGNKAWRSATVVRRQWLASVLLARKTTPDGAALFIARTMAAADSFLIRELSGMSGGSHNVARALLGGIERGTWAADGYRSPLVDSLTGVSEQRAQVVTLALVIGAYEQMTADEQTWRHTPRPAARYLEALASWGYTLSPAEQDVVDAVRTKEKAATAAGQES